MRALSFIFHLLLLVAPVSAALTPAEVTEALGGQSGISWSTGGPDAEAWVKSAGNSLVLNSQLAGPIWYLEANVTGPGVLSLRMAAEYNSYDARITVDGSPSGDQLGSYDAQGDRVEVGPGTHQVRWVLVAKGNYRSATFSGAKWEPFSNTPLQAAATADPSIVFSGPWSGQNRWHHGDGEAAWSGLRISRTTASVHPAHDLSASFSGSGILKFWSKGDRGQLTLDGVATRNFEGNDWLRTFVRVGPGFHDVKWSPAQYYSGSRISSDLLVDDVALLPEIPLPHALGTDGWTWLTDPETARAAYGVAMEEAPGGAGVVIPSSGYLKTTLGGSGVLRIVSKWEPGFRLDGERIFSDVVEGKLGKAPAGLKVFAVVIPSGGGELELENTGDSDLIINGIEFEPPPVDPAVALGLPAGTVTLGGTIPWEVRPERKQGKHVIYGLATREKGDGWIEFPVTGPALVEIGYETRNSWTAFSRFSVDGRDVWEGDSWDTNLPVVLHIPSGSHVVRYLQQHPLGNATYDLDAFVSFVTITPGSAGAFVQETMDREEAWTTLGDWEKDTVITHDGIDSLKPRQTSPQPEEWSYHTVEIPVTGPGYFSAWSYIPEVNGPHDTFSMSISGSFGESQWRTFNDGPKGWQEFTAWVPPGDQRVRWQISGKGEGPSELRLDQVSFTPLPVLPLEEALGGSGLVWANDPVHPWSGVSKDGRTFATSPNLPGSGSSRLSTKVTGPGRLTFDWWQFGDSGLEPELRINGVKTYVPLPWYGNGSARVLDILKDGELTIEWVAEPKNPANRLELANVAWQQWEPVSLAEGADSPAGVTWTSSPDLPFVGRPLPGAYGDDAAAVTVPEGRETWIEASVDGPGIFDFWILSAPESTYNSKGWEIYIDDRKINIYTNLWDPIWITEPGPHRIRLVFRNSYLPVDAVVDQVSWIPLHAAQPPDGLAANQSSAPRAFANGGPDGAGVVVLPVAIGEAWVEQTVTGPGLLEWNYATGDFVQLWERPEVRVTLDGKVPLTVADFYEWTRNRLTIPPGEHKVRWTTNSTTPTSDDGELPNRIVMIAGLAFTPGVSAIEEALDVPDAVWHLTGAGEAVTGTDAADGVDVLRLDEGAELYFCNPTMETVKLDGVSRWAAEGAGWKNQRAVILPGGVRMWASAMKGFNDNGDWKWVDGTIATRFPALTLARALDSPGEFNAPGWSGVGTASAHDGVDAALSVPESPWNANVLKIDVPGASRIRFHWRKEGAALLRVRLNGGYLPLPEATADWSEVEFTTRDGENRIEFIHERSWTLEDGESGEAWLDALEISPVSALTFDQSISPGRLLGLEEISAEPVEERWKPLTVVEDDMAVDVMRCVAGSGAMKAVVEGPMEITFSGRCFGPLSSIPVGGYPLASSAVASSVIIDGGYSIWERNGEQLAFRVDGIQKASIVRPSDDAAGWTEKTIFIPAGRREITWELQTRFKDRYSEATYLAPGVQPGIQGWVKDIRVKSARAFYQDWAVQRGLPEGLSAPDDDADGDGASNAMEYACGTDPTTAAVKPAGPFGTVVREQKYWVTTDGYYYTEGTGPVHYFNVPLVSRFVHGVIETSPDLRVWTEFPVPIPEPGSSGGFGSLFLQPGTPYTNGTHQVLPVVMAPGEPRFFRMKVKVPE